MERAESDVEEIDTSRALLGEAGAEVSRIRWGTPLGGVDRPLNLSFDDEFENDV